MAILVSPGVDVQIINESFYGSSGPGTIPLIVIATAANKLSPSGTGVALGTLPSQAGRLYMMTSQRELIQTFGNPNFYSVQGTQIHGYELNEYGLHAAYQYLGLSNRAYVIRADVDLAQLEPSISPPRNPPLAGTYWFDVAETEWGVFQSNGNAVPGNAWLVQPITVINDFSQVDNAAVPLNTVGEDGDFGIVALDSSNRLYERISGNWLRVGSTDWIAQRPTTVVGSNTSPTATSGDSLSINGTEVTLTGTTAAQTATDIQNASITNITAGVQSGALTITNTAGGSVTLANGSGDPLATFGLPAGEKKGVSLTYAPHTQVPDGSVAGRVWIKTTPPNRGADYKLKVFNGTTGQFVSVTAPLYPSDAAALAGNAFGPAPPAGTLYVRYNLDGTIGQPLASHEIRRWNGSAWEGLVYEAEAIEPTSDPTAGALWYNTDFRADIMYGDGENWIAYRRKYPDTDPDGVLIAGSAPTSQSDGTPLVDNDLWIDASDLENYPTIYRYNATTLRWNRIDNSDQTTPFGIIFADARQDSGPTFTGIANDGAYSFNSEEPKDMALSDFLDPDAPDPRTYPDGMLLFNTRYSTYNVKEWTPFHFNEGGYDPNTDFTVESYNVGEDSTATFPPVSNPGRWVTTSGNAVDGSPYMGRKAQRIMVVRALAATLASNQDIRSEIVHFNLLAAPGYPELLDEMVLLNTDQKETAFIIGDTPIRLAPTGTEIQNWATNANNVASNGEEGKTIANDYIGIYYPWGLSTNIDGSEVMVPPSTIALRTLAYNDQVAYPWFAPAGFQRGLVTNATSVGFLSSEGEFVAVILNQGQRDVLYQNNINPIAFIPGRGLVVYGQKTLSATTSALDRINVARLANYLKFNLDTIVKPFLFEQNDEQTRDSAKATVERFLQGLIGLRALDDFAVICDETNNTPARIDQNQLWIDVLIKPLKAIEFIYIPVRIRNTADPLT